MSLSALNSPPLVGLAGIASFAALPKVRELVAAGTLTWTSLRVANLLAYVINLVAVSLPGRVDGQQQQQESTKSNKDGNKEMETLSPGRQGKTLVAPSGWAFAIWGPIFLGELVMVLAQFGIQDASSPIGKLISQMTAPYVMAQTFQTLWTLAFRPKYMGDGGWKSYISTMMLSGTAYSLHLAHKALSSSGISGWPYLVFGLPVALHFGWTTAASLVNLNGSVSMEKNVSASTVAYLGHASVIVATALGAGLTWIRSAPVYGGVIAWALSAVADGMKKRVANTVKEDPMRVGVYGAALQEKLSRFGALLCGIASFVVTSVALSNGRTMKGIAP